jgi:hypothetical protein
MKLGLARVVVPMGAGVASAFGFLASPMSFAFSRGRVEALAKVDFVAVNRLLDGMEDEGRGLLAAASVANDTIELTVQAAMRYVGQGHEIDVTLSRATVRDSRGDEIAAAFAQAYRRHFGRVEADTPDRDRVLAPGCARAASADRPGSGAPGRRRIAADRFPHRASGRLVRADRRVCRHGGARPVSPAARLRAVRAGAARRARIDGGAAPWRPSPLR